MTLAEIKHELDILREHEGMDFVHLPIMFVDYPSIFPDPYPMPKNPGDPKPYRIVAADHMIAYEGHKSDTRPH